MKNSSSKNTRDISLVIVTYNSSNSIGILLQSLFSSEYPIKETIIIENNSPERVKTTNVINQFKKKHPQFIIKYIQNERNDGFAKSCNLGATIASNNIILFLNPDTRVFKSSISILIHHLVDTNADIIGGKAVSAQGAPHHTAIRTPTFFTGLFEFTNLGKILGISASHKQFYYENTGELILNNDLAVDAISGAYLMITKKAFIKLQGFDEDYFMYLEDVDLGVRAKSKQMKIIYCPHSVIFHEGGASSKNKYRIRHQAWYDSRKTYYKKHFGIIENMLIQPLFNIEERILKILRSHQ